MTILCDICITLYRRMIEKPDRAEAILTAYAKHLLQDHNLKGAEITERVDAARAGFTVQP
jgi:hypothetical protein